MNEWEMGYLSAPAELMWLQPRPADVLERWLAALVATLVESVVQPERLVVGEVDYGAAQTAEPWEHLRAPGCRAVVLTAPASEVSTSLAAGDVCGYETKVWSRIATEAPDIAQTLCGSLSGGVWLATDDAAEESGIRRALPGMRVVHVATHGFYSPADDCQERESREKLQCGAFRAPAMVASSGGPIMSAATGLAGSSAIDPLKLAGLVLAGANAGGVGTDRADPKKDGILSGRESAGLNLSAAELVVLSACETGRGEVHAGEGALGLGKAFQIAGTRSVVVSQWKVPARETALLFEDIYRRLYGEAESGAARPDAVTALREAQLARLAAAREAGLSASSFLWGAFVALQ